jgi:pyruvate kinase
MTEHHYKHRFTKIIFTIGPATDSEIILEKMIRQGVDVCRINMAHADHAWTRSIIQKVRSVCHKLDREVAIMMDVKGPEIRTGDLDQPIELIAGDRLDLTFNQGIGKRAADGVYRVDVNYAALTQTLKVGDSVLVDNGLIRMRVIEIDSERVRCEVQIPGPMGNRRHINLPGVRVQLPCLTEKDKADIQVGIEQKVDFFALSFVRESADLDYFHSYLKEHQSAARVIAKVEDQQAITNLEEIIAASDGLMVARGDLGIECPFEDLPIIQKRAVQLCLKHSKPVIIATHMLESMINSPLPTRAEVSDISNAVLEQADCVMLSGETTVGKYPVECVEILQRIAIKMENQSFPILRKDLVLLHPKAKMQRAAAYLASELEAGIVIFTNRGAMAQMLSSLRPTKVPLYAFTENSVLYRQLLLLWGVEPFLIKFNSEEPEETIQTAFKLLKKKGLVKINDPIVVVSNVMTKYTIFEAIQLRRVTE